MGQHMQSHAHTHTHCLECDFNTFSSKKLIHYTVPSIMCILLFIGVHGVFFPSFFYLKKQSWLFSSVCLSPGYFNIMFGCVFLSNLPAFKLFFICFEYIFSFRFLTVLLLFSWPTLLHCDPDLRYLLEAVSLGEEEKKKEKEKEKTHSTQQNVTSDLSL